MMNQHPSRTRCSWHEGAPVRASVGFWTKVLKDTAAFERYGELRLKKAGVCWRIRQSAFVDASVALSQEVLSGDAEVFVAGASHQGTLEPFAEVPGAAEGPVERAHATGSGSACQDHRARRHCNDRTLAGRRQDVQTLGS